MNLNKGSKSAFTLVEVLVAIVLVGIALTATLGAIGSLTASFRRSVELENLQRLANEKLDEVLATGEWQTASEGGFEGDLYEDYTWSIETETTTVAGLEYVRLTVTRNFAGREDSTFVEGLAYLAETTTVPLEGGGQ